MSGSPVPGFWRVFRRELLQIGSVRSLPFMLAPYPLILFLVLAATFHAGLPTGLPVAVVDQDGSQMSRQMVRMVDDTPDLTVVAELPDLSEAREALLAYKVYGIILVPPNMERDLLSWKRPEVVIFYNNQMLTVGGIVARTAGSALSSFSSGVSIQLRQSQGQTMEEAMAGVNPIPIQQSPLFNPALDYTQFLLASIMPTVLQIFICASAVLAVSRDRHSRAGTARLVAQGGSSLPALTGKLAPYGLAYFTMLALADMIVFGYFGAPFRGNIGLHLLYSALFVSACLSLGALLALVSDSALTALGIAGVLTAPAFGFAGISFPRLVMNAFAIAWGSALPLTSYLQLRVDQAVRGADITLSLPALGWLAGLWAIYTGVALLLLSRRERTRGSAAEEMTA